MKRLKLILLSFCVWTLTATGLFGQVTSLKITTSVVDGLGTNRNVVILVNSVPRAPLFAWTCDTRISSFTLIVATSTAGLSNGTTIWYTSQDPPKSENETDLGTAGYRYFIKYGGSQLTVGDTYYWKVDVALARFGEDSLVATRTDEFTTIATEIDLPRANFDLQVDHNNPFNPPGQVTKFRYEVKGTQGMSVNVKLTVYTLSGEYVKELVNHPALQDAEYIVEWNGRDESGEIMPSGIYLVHLWVEDEATGVTRRVAITKK